MVELRLTKAPSGARLTKRDFLRWEKRQVFDLPEPKLVVTEYRVAVFRDPATGKDCKEAFPDGVEAPAQYGTGALAFMVYLHTQQHLPLEEISAVANRAVTCECNPGDILLMSPLILHASRRAEPPTRRRIIHIEYARAHDLAPELTWLEDRHQRSRET